MTMISDHSECCGGAAIALANGVRAAEAVVREIHEVRDPTPPFGIPRPDERRSRHYFVNAATDLQVLVNVWPDGTLDAAFETEPGVFGAPVSARRIESEVVG